MLGLQLNSQSTRRLGAFFVLAFLGLNAGFAQLTIDSVQTTNVMCNGGENGQAEVFFSGGTAPFAVTWSDGQTGNVASNLEAGTYSVIVADSLGAADSASVEITQPAPISVAVTTVLPVCPGDSTGMISIIPQGGTPPYDIFWNTTETGPVINNVPPGIYFAFIIDANGCLFTQQITLQNNDPEPPVLVVHDAVVPLNPITGTAIMEPILFVDLVSDNCQVDGVNVAPVMKDCDDLGPNTIFVAAVDNSGNITTEVVTATIVDITPPMLFTENITVSLGAGGTVTVDPEDLSSGSFDNCGIASLTLDISEFDCSMIGDNAVTLTAIDGSGNVSTAVAVVTIEDNTPPAVVTQNITVQLDTGGQATITPSDLDGGSVDNCGILLLEAGQTTFTCADLNGGNPVEVTLTITDVNGNEGSAAALVTVTDTIPPVITCPEDLTGDFCQIFLYPLPTATDNCDVEIDQTEGLGSGSVFQYGTHLETFVATDAYGNTATCTVTITVANDFNIDAAITDVSCNGLADGSVELTVTGGTPPYLYFWSPSGPDNLSSGIYTVTIFDNLGCESVQNYVVNEPNPLEIGLVTVVNATNGQANGGFSLLLTGGTQPYTWEGNVFGDTLVVDDLAAGTYAITITDANGCEISTSITIDNINSASEPEMLRQFAVFPNPARNFATAEIQFREPTRMQASLVDLSGRTIRTWPMVQAEHQTLRIDLQGLAPGMYAVKLNVNGEIVVRNISIQ